MEVYAGRYITGLSKFLMLLNIELEGDSVQTLANLPTVSKVDVISTIKTVEKGCY